MVIAADVKNDNSSCKSKPAGQLCDAGLVSGSMASAIEMLRLAPLDGAMDVPPSGHLDRLGRKIGHHTSLSQAEVVALAAWLGRSIRSVRPGISLIERGAVPSEINIVLSGWGCRYRVGPSGRRQIFAFCLPGDVCEFNAFLMSTMDSTIMALSHLQVACISRSALNQLAAEHPKLSQGLWWDAMVSASIQREWMLNITQRSGRDRIAHLLCELAARLDAVGMFDGRTLDLPFTQTDLGDACAMTQEHTNRMLRDLRDAGLITQRRGTVEICDWAGLKRLAGFDDRYLTGRG